MEAKRELILSMHLQGKKFCEIFRALKSVKVNYKLIQRTIKRFSSEGSITPRRKRNRICTVRTKGLIKRVNERIKRNRRQSQRKMALELKVSKTTIHNIIKKNLNMHAYKKRKVHGLTANQKIARYKKCQRLLQWHAGDDIIFSDEKLFLLQNYHNSQNDRVYAKCLSDIPIEQMAVERYQNASGVMVWGGISKRGKLPLKFIERGVKINAEYYLKEVLENHMLPYANALFGDDYYCFQQDSAPSHKARSVQRFLEENTPDFLTVEDWPAASPDLNPLDYTIWSYMLSKLNNTANMNLETFKKHLIKIWNNIPDDVVRASCESWEHRLRRVVKAKGERIELMY